uniref:DUF4283 domain-containing protein n=1 Tax=Cannabis sativa TaxID=3483 RepID=A0A803QS94_CANSA
MLMKEQSPSIFLGLLQHYLTLVLRAIAVKNLQRAISNESINNIRADAKSSDSPQKQNVKTPKTRVAPAVLWRRIIALLLGRRGSRPPVATMAFASPPLPVSLCSRYYSFLLLYLRFCSLCCIYPSPVSLPIFDHLSVFSLHLKMATFPVSQSTQLTAEEALVHDFDHVSIHPEPQSQSHCLVVKVLSPKTLKVNWIQKAMNEAWVARCPFSFSEYHLGLLLVQFGCEGDRRRVMEGQPWHFDRSLMIFAIPDGFDTILPSQLRYIPLWVQVHYIPLVPCSWLACLLVVDNDRTPH